MGVYCKPERPNQQSAEPYWRTVALSAVGKSAGTFCVTWPLAAHSTPRWKVAMKATLFMFGTSCPRHSWKTRPLPYWMVNSTGSCSPAPPFSLGAKAVASTVRFSAGPRSQP